jgi:1-hydroxy-2-naphthoate dioxygenase
LNQPFYETYGGSTHPLLPQAPGHPYRFPWNAAREKLYSLAPAELDRFDGAVLQYVDPTTGAAVLPTFGCYLTLLRGGFRGEEQRLSSSAVYHVVQGSGTALIGGQQLEWGPRDTFAIPNWTHHRLLNGSATEDAILFKVSDRPILAALGLVREERPGL